MSRERGGICIIVGEASGDVQASHVVAALRAELKERGLGYVPFWGAAGPALREQGVEPVVACEDLAVMGWTEVLGNYMRISSHYHSLLRELDRRQPMAVICVDYPGFNLKFARDAWLRGNTVLFHIPPKVWAHGWKRVERLRRCAHLVTSILPFETDRLRKAGVPVKFIGNPLRDAVDAYLKERSERHGTSLFSRSLPSEGMLRLGLLPGSRRSEIELVFPSIVQAFALFEQKVGRPVQGFVPVAATLDESYVRTVAVKAAVAVGRDKEWVERSLVFGKSNMYEVLSTVDYAWVCSGTAALETAFFGVPMSVVYRMQPLSYHISKAIIRIPYVSLVNLSANAPLVPEFLQHQATPENLANHALSMISDLSARERMIHALGQVRDLFPVGAPQHAAREMAETIVENLVSSSEKFRRQRIVHDVWASESRDSLS